jgi:hypothetical protein
MKPLLLGIGIGIGFFGACLAVGEGLFLWLER